MNIIKKEIIVQVGNVKLHDVIGDMMVTGFSADGKEVYMMEYGEEGGVWPIDEIKNLQ